jgi:hypothetical protein
MEPEAVASDPRIAILETENLICRNQLEIGQRKSTPPLAEDSSGA